MADATLEPSGVSHATEPSGVSHATSDAALLRRFATGRDAAAFAELVRRYGRLVWGVCRRRLVRPEDAEDAFQATFLALAARAASIRNAEALPGWLHSTACRAAVRVASAPPRASGRETAATGLDVVAELVRLEEVVALDEEIVRLPDRYQAPLVLFHLEGLDRREVADRLGLSETGVKTLLRRGRSLLRSRLVRRGVALPAVLPFAVEPVPAAAAVAGGMAGSTGLSGLSAVAPVSGAKAAGPAVSWAGGASAATAVALAGAIGMTLLLAPGDARHGRHDLVAGEVVETVLAPEPPEATIGVVGVGTPPAGGRSGLAFDPAAAELRSALDEPATLRFPNTPLPDALDVVAALHNIKVEIDRPGLEAAGVLGRNGDATVTIAVAGVRLGTALDRMLKPIGLTYVVKGETLFVTTIVSLAEESGTRVGRDG
jgi:RNA polymerase sigma factor (sigma-70 family)